MRVRTLTALLGAAIGAFFVHAPQAGAAVTYFKSISLNVAGNTRMNGSTADMPLVAQLIADRQPQTVGLQEFCRNQADALANDLNTVGGAYYPMYKYFHATRQEQNGTIAAGPTCNNGQDYGNLILTRAAVSTTGWIDLGEPNQDTENREQICVVARIIDVPSRICSTHLDAGNEPNRNYQVRQVRDYDYGRIQLGEAVVQTGDFNYVFDGPEMQGTMYQIMREADNTDALNVGSATPANEDTIEKDFQPDVKIDYVFTSTNGFTNNAADAQDINEGSIPVNTDHRLLLGYLYTKY